MRANGVRLTLRVIFVALLTIAMVAAVSCTDEEPGHNDEQRDAGEPDDVDDEDTGPDFECEPGELVECTDAGHTTYHRCNDEGDDTEVADCPGSSICEDDQCVEVNCIPGNRRCESEDQPQVCEPDGEGDFEFVDDEPCGDEENCEDGQCLDACGQAELTDSYIGCEYWALETDNRLLHTDSDGSQSVDPEHRPPFAVVLTNTQVDATAEVTVTGPNGEIAEAIGEREVRSHRTNPGTDYETVYSETVDGDGNRIGGPHHGPIEDIDLPPGTTLTLLLPNQDVPFGETTVTSTAYKVETTQPVVAYQFNPFCCNYNYTNDASMLIPTSALSENYMMTSHAVWAREEQATLRDPFSPTLSVVGLEPDTTVQIQLRKPVFNQMSSDAVAFDEQCPPTPGSANTQASMYGDSDTGACFLYPVRPGDGIAGPDSLGRMEVTLDEHEVFNVAAGGAYPTVDLTGALVTADKEVAVFGAHTCINVPFTRSACDHVESQLFPLESWGTSFIVPPHKIRNPDADSSSDEGTYWKFVGRDDGTTINASISVDPSDTLPPSGEGVARCGSERFSDDPESGEFQLDRGEYCEFGTREGFEVLANQPINIAGFMSGQNTVFDQVDWGDHAGDPSMFMVPPRDQYRNEYHFLVPPTYHDNFITVTVPVGPDVVLNGEMIDPTDHDYEEVEGTNHIMAHIPVDPGPYHIETTTGHDFGLVVYGYDNYVSYSYTGGLDLEKDHEFEQ